MFTLTNTGVDLLRNNGTPSAMDFTIKRDGERWVYYHYAKKAACAVFFGGTSADAHKALKLHLITRRLTR